MQLDVDDFLVAAREAVTEDSASLLSSVALDALKRVNPYAERFYDYSIHSAGKDVEDSMELATQFKRAALDLGEAIVRVAPLQRDQKGVSIARRISNLYDTVIIPIAD